VTRRPSKDTLPMPEPPGASRDRMLGRLVEGRYRVQRQLGRGAMGTIYEVADERTRERFALKALRPGIVGPFGDVKARFAREARATSLLQHPNIVAVHAFGQLGKGLPYLLMEFVEGQGLGELLDRGRVPVRRALGLTRQMLSGVGYAHALGMVHRDLKPDNVMIATDEEGADHVKLLDFGIVKLVGELAAAEVGSEELTQAGVVFGTPAYMAPEQILSRTLDGRADLYAIGCLFFEMVTGRSPFHGDERMEILKGHVSIPPPTLAAAGLEAPVCTPELEALVSSSLAKDPDQRFAGATQMIAALDAAARALEPDARCAPPVRHDDRSS
jgi:eukaryotic-like serine/threonine-protein kinase